MSLGEGWFIDLVTGDYFPIFEHAQAVVNEPGKFRIEKMEIDGLSQFKDRKKILRLALSRGFVRVRASKGNISMEYDHPDRSIVYHHLKRFLDRAGFFGFVNIRINSLENPVDSFRGNFFGF